MENRVGALVVGVVVVDIVSVIETIIGGKISCIGRALDWQLVGLRCFIGRYSYSVPELEPKDPIQTSNLNACPLIQNHSAEQIVNVTRFQARTVNLEKRLAGVCVRLGVLSVGEAWRIAVMIALKGIVGAGLCLGRWGVGSLRGCFWLLVLAFDLVGSGEMRLDEVWGGCWLGCGAWSGGRWSSVRLVVVGVVRLLVFGSGWGAWSQAWMRLCIEHVDFPPGC
ncbi:hypothetical protein Tco_0481786 [Tanacetum coccineum]